MARNQLEYPSNIKLETSLGKVKLSFVSGDCIRVDTTFCDYVNNFNNYYTISVGKLNYHITCLYLSLDCSDPTLDRMAIDSSAIALWRFKEGSSVYIDYKNSKGQIVNASNRATETIVTVIVSAINQWAIANPIVLEKAAYVEANNSLLELEKRTDRLTQSIQASQQELLNNLASLQQLNIAFTQRFPTTIEQLDVLPLNLFKDAVKLGIKHYFTEERRVKLDPERLELEALATLVGYFTQWLIESTFHIVRYILEDLDLHEQAKAIEEILNSSKKF